MKLDFEVQTDTPHIFLKNTKDTGVKCRAYALGRVTKGPHQVDLHFNDNEGDSSCDIPADSIMKGYGSVIHELLHAIGMFYC